MSMPHRNNHKSNQVKMTPWTVTTECAERTRALGRIVGEALQAGIRISLMGNLGSGKTVFVQGLAQGVGVPSEYYITSPTYTLVNEYSGRINFYHVDLYRLATAEEIENLGLGDILALNAVIAIEWGDRLDQQDLGEHLAVNIQITKQDQRKFTMTAYGRSHQILLKEIEKNYGAFSWD